MTRSSAIDRERLMTRRTLQVWGSDVLPMTPSLERIAAELSLRATCKLERQTELVRMEDGRVIAIGGGRVVEIDVSKPSIEWTTSPSPVQHSLQPGTQGQPLMLGAKGEVLELRSDLSTKQLWSGGIVSAVPLVDGSIIYQPERRLIFGTWLVDRSGAVRWRIRGRSVVEAALDDVIFAFEGGSHVMCRTTATGDLLWTRRGRLKAIVDDVAWLGEGTCIVSYGLERGDERARIDFKLLGSGLRVDPEGRGHLFGHGRYWTIDLRSARILTRFEYTNPPRDLYAELPVNDGLLVRSSEHALYYLPIRDGEGPLPPPLWRSDVVITRVVPHRNGLLVITNPSAPRSPTLHWLAPNEHS